MLRKKALPLKYPSDSNSLVIGWGMDKISEEDITKIVEFLEENLQITRLLIHKTHIFLQLLPCLIKLTHITEIVINRFSINNLPIDPKSAAVLARMDRLKHLTIHATTDDAGIVEISNSKSLIYLNARKNDLHLRGALALAKSSIPQIDLGWNTNIPSAGFAAFQKNSFLHTLSAKFCNLDDAKIILLTKIPFLRHLDIEGNAFSTHQTVQALIQSKIESLDITQCRYSGNSDALVTQLSGESKTITKLGLGRLKLSQCATALAMNSRLTDLDVSYNKFKEKDLEILANSSSLTSIDFRDNLNHELNKKSWVTLLNNPRLIKFRILDKPHAYNSELPSWFNWYAICSSQERAFFKKVKRNYNHRVSIAHLALLIASMRANQDSQIQNSLFELFPLIMQLADLEPKASVIQPKITRMSFFKNQINLQNEDSLATPMQKVKKTGSPSF